MIRLENVAKVYGEQPENVFALNDVNLQVAKGEFVVIRGPSGSGKTTLLLTAGAMLKPAQGQVSIAGEYIYQLDHAQRAKVRSKRIGFVFQLFHLVPYLSVTENVLLGISAGPATNGTAQAEAILEKLGLKSRRYHRPAGLSAGEKQRTALARAFIKQPDILLADEPTGNLDPENSETVLDAIVDFQRHGGTTLLVTHSNDADKYADRVVILKEGRIVSG